MVRQGNAALALWLQIVARKRNIQKVREYLTPKEEIQLRTRNRGNQNWKELGSSFLSQKPHFLNSLPLDFCQENLCAPQHAG